MQASAESMAGRREWIGLAVLALPTFLASMDLTLPHLALPSISTDLAASSTEQLWIVDIYAFLLAGSLITMGTLGDRIGRRKLLLIGAVAFAIGSVFAAYSTSPEMLIAARAFLGLAAATLMPSTLSLITTMFGDPRQRTIAIGVIIASVSGGTAIGPLLGGWLLTRFWWGSVFLLAVPVMALLLALGPSLLPEYRNPDAGRFDVTSALLWLSAVLAVIYGLKRISGNALVGVPAVTIIAGLAMSALFLRRQRKLSNPLVDLRLFKNSAFSASLGILLLGIFVLWGATFYIAQYLQLVRGLSPLEAGLWTAPSAAGVIVGSLLAPRIVRRIRPGLVIGTGLLIAAGGFAIFTQVDTTSVLAVPVVAAVVISLGLGPMMTLSTDMAIKSAPREQAGAAAALSSTAPQFGGALGIAILGSIGTAVYRRNVADASQAGASSDMSDTARDSLSGAVTVADQLAGQPGMDLLDSARDAFIQGMHVNVILSSVFMIAAAIAAAVLLRHTSPSSQIREPAEVGGTQRR